MSETILIGTGRAFTEMPRPEWEAQLAHAPEVCKKRMQFMTEDHHRVRYFVVEQIARRGEPLTPETIGGALDIEPGRLAGILDELEANLFFLVRNDAGAVSWAYPVTAEETPHRLVFSTGERLHGA